MRSPVSNLAEEPDPPPVPPGVPADPQAVESFRRRYRMLRRSLMGGPSVLSDGEILEVLLTSTRPNASAERLALLLLERFGTLAAVLQADVDALLAVDGLDEADIAMLTVIGHLPERMARADILGQEVLTNWDALARYLQAGMAHKRTERYRILFLDGPGG